MEILVDDVQIGEVAGTVTREASNLDCQSKQRSGSFLSKLLHWEPDVNIKNEIFPNIFAGYAFTSGSNNILHGYKSKMVNVN